MEVLKVIFVLFVLFLSGTGSDVVEGPSWTTCSESNSPFIPNICGTFTIEDSCNASFSLFLESNPDGPALATQVVPLSQLEEEGGVCFQPGDSNPIVAVGCETICISLATNHSQADDDDEENASPTLACPIFESINCTLLPDIPPGECKPAPQLDEPCVVSPPPQESYCPNDCSASSDQGRCDERSGYCVCQPSFGGEDCSAQCSIEAIMNNEQQYRRLPLFESTSALHEYSYQATSSGEGQVLALEIPTPNLTPYKNTDNYWWLPFAVSSAYVQAVITSDESFEVSHSPGCPPDSSSPRYNVSAHNQLSMYLYDPQLLFPIPDGSELWFLSLQPASTAPISVQVNSPWLYSALIEVFVLNGVATWVDPGTEVFFTFNLSYASPVYLTATSSRAPIELLTTSMDGSCPPATPLLDESGLTISVNLNSPQPTSTWVVRIRLSDCPDQGGDEGEEEEEKEEGERDEPNDSPCDPSSTTYSSLVTLRAYVEPSCPYDCARDQGFCYYDGACFCFSGWTGINCSEPVCSPPCGLGGTCTLPDTCTCNPGWTGPYCVDYDPNSTTWGDGDSNDDSAYSWLDILLPPFLILFFLLFVPLSFWLFSKREACLRQPSYDLITT